MATTQETTSDEQELAAVREALFSVFDAFQKWNHMGASAIAHPKAGPYPKVGWKCIEPSLPIPIRWVAFEAPALTATEHMTLEMVEAAAKYARTLSAFRGLTITLSKRLHMGTCERCGKQAAEATVLISMAWQGRVLSREYAL